MAATAELNRLVAGRYQVVGKLGGGGTSLVSRARDITGGPDVALKQLRPEFANNRAIRRRFVREAELTRRLDHPAIVHLLDVVEDQDLPLLVLELVSDGRSGRCSMRDSSSTTRRSDPPSPRSLTLSTTPTAEASSTRISSRRTSSWMAGRSSSPTSATRGRVVGQRDRSQPDLGTPEYVAPELFSRALADPRSDFYSLGVILHEMLTGRRPWSRAETLSRLAATSRPPRLRRRALANASTACSPSCWPPAPPIALPPETRSCPDFPARVAWVAHDIDLRRVWRRPAGRRPTLLHLRPRAIAGCA